MFDSVMPALVAGIHVFLVSGGKQGVDGRDKPGHDAENAPQADGDTSLNATRSNVRPA
jgi:hypothetical protein